MIFIDGTEQPVRRPKNRVDQKDNYSGKKKRHTSKVLVVTNQDNRIEVMTPVYVGSSHDFAIFKTEEFSAFLPAGTPVYIDTGFEGADKICKRVNFKKPKKKRRNRKLNGGEQHGNRTISRVRVKVEHAIGKMKKFKSVADICRNITKSMDQTFQVIAGIVNFQIDRSRIPLAREAI